VHKLSVVGNVLQKTPNWVISRCCFSEDGKGRDTRCDKSLRHVAATGCCNKSPRVTCENHCSCDRILSLRSVPRIQTGLNSCDVSQRQNLNQTMRKHQLVSSHVIFELVYISSLPKSITCTEQVSYRSDLSQDQCRRGDLSPRCVAAICRIVCLGLTKCSKNYSARAQPIFCLWNLLFSDVAVVAMDFLNSVSCGRRVSLMVSALVSGSSDSGLSPSRGHNVVFLDKTLCSQCLSPPRC